MSKGCFKNERNVYLSGTRVKYTVLSMASFDRMVGFGHISNELSLGLVSELSEWKIKTMHFID